MELKPFTIKLGFHICKGVFCLSLLFLLLRRKRKEFLLTVSIFVLKSGGSLSSKFEKMAVFKMSLSLVYLNLPQFQTVQTGNKNG